MGNMSGSDNINCRCAEHCVIDTMIQGGSDHVVGGGGN